MLKKLVLAAAAAGYLLAMNAALAAKMETTIWTLKCSTSGQTRKIKVTAEDRETARMMVEKEATSSGFCLQPHNLEFIKVEELK